MLKVTGGTKLIKSFNTHIITNKVHESSLISASFLYNFDLGLFNNSNDY